MNKRTLDVILGSYLTRVRVQPGNGLTKGMNQTLRTYPMIPDIIERIVDLLVVEEHQKGVPVRLKPLEAYDRLLAMANDWAIEVPVIRGGLKFERKPKKRVFSLPAFHGAMTIARRIGVIAGHGRFGLSEEVRRVLATAGQVA